MALSHVLVRHPAELVDIEVIIGEDDEVLEMLGIGAGVMAQPEQRIIDARRGEGSERVRAALRRNEGAVGDLVIGEGEVGRIEQVA